LENISAVLYADKLMISDEYEKPRQVVCRRGSSVFYRGKALLSTVDPVAAADRLAVSIPLREQTLYFCPSPLYGYGLSTLLDRLPDMCAILCIECDAALAKLTAGSDMVMDLINSDSRICLTTCSEPTDVCSVVYKAWGSRAFRRVETVRFSAGWQLYQERYQELASTISRNIALEWGNAMTLIKLGRQYIRNAIRNLPLITRVHPLSDLSFGASPVLVLGAGPSLDALLAVVQNCFGSALYNPATRPFRIVAVDSCLSALHDRRIVPDLIVALESQHWNLRDFIGSRNWHVPVAMDLSALPATAEILDGPVFLFATLWTKLRFFDRLRDAGLLPETIVPLGSVGLTAVALSLRLSSGTVMCAGLDFSFTLDAYHARSTPSHREKLFHQTRFSSILNASATFRKGVSTVQSKSGQLVHTDPSLRTYRNVFEQEFSGYSRLFDITGTGLPLGVQTVSIEKVCTLLTPSLSFSTTPSMRTTLFASPSYLSTFINHEIESLSALRDILTGNAPPENLDQLLDDCDYLFIHFPECAGTDRHRPARTDTTFLKRVRAEIDTFIAIAHSVL
jgi:hypothetical protein